MQICEVSLHQDKPLLGSQQQPAHVFHRFERFDPRVWSICERHVCTENILRDLLTMPSAEACHLLSTGAYGRGHSLSTGRCRRTSVSALAFLAFACAFLMCLSFSLPKLASSFSSACTRWHPGHYAVVKKQSCEDTQQRVRTGHNSRAYLNDINIASGRTCKTGSSQYACTCCSGYLSSNFSYAFCGAHAKWVRRKEKVWRYEQYAACQIHDQIASSV